MEFVPYKRWLHQQDDKIKDEYPERTTGEIAGETGLNYYTVSRRAKRLGVAKSEAFLHSSWKKGGCRQVKRKTDTDEYMREHFHDTTNEELSARFGVDVKTVRRWARSMGLVKSKGFMNGRRHRQKYYDDEMAAARNRRIAEVYPDADEDVLERLAEELGISRITMGNIANQNGIIRSKESRKKYSTSFVNELAEYFPDHSNDECAAHFGIKKQNIVSVAQRYGMRKNKEYLSEMRRMAMAKARKTYKKVRPASQPSVP